MIDKTQLLSQVTSTGPGPAVPVPATEHPDFLRSFQVGMTGGTACEVNIEASIDGKTWLILAIVSLAADEADGVSCAVPWRYVRGNVVSVSGGGVIDALMGTQRA